MSNNRRINEERKKRALEKRQTKAPCSMSPAPSIGGPPAHGFSKRKYQFKGYMAEDKFIEVKPAPMNHAPKFKNKIEEYLYRGRMSLRES